MHGRIFLNSTSTERDLERLRSLSDSPCKLTPLRVSLEKKKGISQIFGRKGYAYLMRDPIRMDTHARMNVIYQQKFLLRHHNHMISPQCHMIGLTLHTGGAILRLH